MGLTFPDSYEETAGDQTWTVLPAVNLDRFQDAQNYFLADYRIVLEAKGRLNQFAPSKNAALELSLKTAAGRLPLSFFPFLLSGAAGNGSITELIAGKKLQLLPSRLKDLAPRALVTARPLIPPDPSSFLAAAAKIKFLQPNRLDRAELRRAWVWKWSMRRFRTASISFEATPDPEAFSSKAIWTVSSWPSTKGGNSSNSGPGSRSGA